MAALTYNGIIYDTDDVFSGRDFTGRVLTAFDLSNRVIYAAVFAQEAPDTLVFDPSTTGTTFLRCNLTNVLVPPGNTVIDCVTTRAATQNDGRVWEIDAANRPIRLTAEKHWRMLGTSTDPADISATRLRLAPGETLETRLAQEQAARVVSSEGGR